MLYITCFLIDEILYHSIAEAITIVSAVVILVILLFVWSSIRENIFISLTCISTVIVSFLDILHIFAYPGLSYFPTSYPPGTLITSFWIYARYFQATTIIIAILIQRYSKKVNYLYLIISFISAALLGTVLILLKIFPITYISGVGLSPFKIISEYIIMFLFIISGYLIIKFKLSSDTNLISLYIVFILFQTITEYFFTDYILPTDYSLFIGHYFKILASFILTYILIRSTIASPNEILFKQVITQKNQLSKMLKYEKLLREVTEIAVTATDKKKLTKDILTIYGSTLEVDHSFIYRYNKGKKTFSLESAWFNPLSELKSDDESYEFNETPEFKQKLESGATHYCADTSRLQNIYERKNFENLGIISYINAPLFLFGEFYGFIGYNMTLTNRLSIADDIILTKSISSITTQTIERIMQFKEIEFMSVHDSLTGAFNRTYFESLIKKIDKVDYYPLGIVSIDLNGLKLINDAFVHLAGDEMLIKVVEVIESALGDLGTLCRIGGDEFSVLLPNTTKHKIYDLFKKIEKQCEVNYVNSIQMSLSYGIHVRNSNHTTFYEEFKIAEDEMYRMKLLDVPSMRADAIEAILSTLYEKDVYSKDHSSKVSLLAARLASFLGFNVNEINDIKMAGLLHDIGKIIVPDNILKKQGKLDNSEYLEIKKHSEIGFRILCSTKDFRKIADYVLSHHEHYDGNGYPHGLKETEIPIEARIISVVDAFDAMLSIRSYRKQIDKEAAIKEIRRCSGTQFDPGIVEEFIQHIEEITEGLYK